MEATIYLRRTILLRDPETIAFILKIAPPRFSRRGVFRFGYAPATGSGCGPLLPAAPRPRRLSGIRPIKKALTAKLDISA